MKKQKLLSILLAMSLLTTAFSAVACENESPTTNTHVGEEPVEKETLSAPTNVWVKDEIVHWDAVENAGTYVVQVDGTEVSVAKQENACMLSELLKNEIAENVEIKVKAVPASGDEYNESEWSEPCKTEIYRGGESELVSDTNGDIRNVKSVQCVAKPVADITEDYSSFKDDEYFYYVFYSGRIYNVALENGKRQYHYGFEEMELGFETTTTTTSTIKTATSETMTKATEKNYSVSESFKYTRGGPEFSLGIGFLEIGYKSNNSFELGLSATQSFGFSDSTTVSTSYEECVVTANAKTETFTLKINSNYPSGNYMYGLLGDLDVYNAVVLNPTTGEFEIFTFSSIVRSNWQLIYLGEELEYCNEPANPLLFNLNEVESCLSVEPTMHIEKDTEEKYYTISSLVKSCDQDNGYDYRKTDSGDDLTRHDGFDMGEIIIGGTKQIGNLYRITNREKFKLTYHVLVDPNDLKIDNTQVSHIENDNYSGKIYETTLNDNQIGYGAYIIKYTYSDYTEKIYYQTNVFKNKNKGDYIEINSTLEEGKDLVSIKITFVYEIYCGAPGFLGIWWHEYTNWRSDYTINFQ